MPLDRTRRHGIEEVCGLGLRCSCFSPQGFWRRPGSTEVWPPRAAAREYRRPEALPAALPDPGSPAPSTTIVPGRSIPTDPVAGVRLEGDPKPPALLAVCDMELTGQYRNPKPCRELRPPTRRPRFS